VRCKPAILDSTKPLEISLRAFYRCIIWKAGRQPPVRGKVQPVFDLRFPESSARPLCTPVCGLQARHGGIEQATTARPTPSIFAIRQRPCFPLIARRPRGIKTLPSIARAHAKSLSEMGAAGFRWRTRIAIARSTVSQLGIPHAHSRSSKHLRELGSSSSWRSTGWKCRLPPFRPRKC